MKTEDIIFKLSDWSMLSTERNLSLNSMDTPFHFFTK